MSDVQNPTRLLFTIGHSSHELADFIALLKTNGVDAIADVRTSPWSQQNSQYNQSHLQQALLNKDIQYVFLGEQLGARRIEPECYVENKASYRLIEKLPKYQEGLERIRRGAKKFTIAMMCAEKDPITCHRTILVCRSLRNENFAIMHILENGLCESQAHAESRLINLFAPPSLNMFEDREALIQKAFDKQADKIAYVARSGNGEGDEAQ